MINLLNTIKQLIGLFAYKLGQLVLLILCIWVGLCMYYNVIQPILPKAKTTNTLVI
jgi:hypothetical protein